MMHGSQIHDVELSLECDLEIAIEGLRSFRLNTLRQRGDVVLG